MSSTTTSNPREMARDFYKDRLQKNAMLISNAISSFIRVHADCVTFNDDEDELTRVDVFVLDPSKKDMELADAVYALSNPSFDWLSTSQDVKDYLKVSFNNDLQEHLRKFGMALFDMETIPELHTQAEHENASNFDEDGDYIGPSHSGLRVTYCVWPPHRG